jgi:hypothetical protein
VKIYILSGGYGWFFLALAYFGTDQRQAATYLEKSVMRKSNGLDYE